MTRQEIYKKELREFLNEINASEEDIDRSVEVFLGTHETQHVTYIAMNVFGNQEYNQALEEVKILITSLPLREPDIKYINQLIGELKK